MTAPQRNLAYTPREGSLPDKVLGVLENSPLGTLLTVAEIAKAFGVPDGDVIPCLKPAVGHSALHVNLKDGKRAYGLGPGPGLAQAAPPAVAAPKTQWVSMGEPDPRQAPGVTIEVPARAIEEAANPSADPADDPQFALWCDGTLHLHGVTPRPDGVIELPLHQTARLARLLHGFTFDQ